MKPRVLVLLLAAAALIAKNSYCAATTIGSSDVAIFFEFARTIHHYGLLATYQATPLFNHTPLVGWFAEAAYSLARGDKQLFVLYLRLPAIFADLFAVMALIWFQEKTRGVGAVTPNSQGETLAPIQPNPQTLSTWALCLFAASPVAFMVSGYHGNVDSVMALGVLLAGIACAVGRPALCGLCLGFACNIKIIPLLLIPAFFFVWWHQRQAWRFALALALSILVGWSYPLMTIPLVFIKNVLGYGSIWGLWGITYLLCLTHVPALRNIALLSPSAEQSAIMSALKCIIVVAALVLAWRGRRAKSVEIFQTLSLVWAVFFVFAPGFGAQYLAWLMPCFLLANERWYAWLTGASSVALFVFYHTISGHKFPWMQGFNVLPTAPQWTWSLLLPWLVLVAFLFRQLGLAWRKTVRSPAWQAEPLPVYPAC